jgi:hypothetical protein
LIENATAQFGPPPVMREMGDAKGRMISALKLRFPETAASRRRWPREAEASGEGAEGASETTGTVDMRKREKKRETQTVLLKNGADIP